MIRVVLNEMPRSQHSPEVNIRIKLIGLMAVCMDHILCDTLKAL